MFVVLNFVTTKYIILHSHSVLCIYFIYLFIYLFIVLYKYFIVPGTKISS
jgi:hypothetical protein